MFEIKNESGEIKARIWQIAENIESSAWEQIRFLYSHPCVTVPIAIMPDVHCGIGATIGAVIPVEEALIPNAVGVDIGCGMMSMQTSLKEENIIPVLNELITSIKRRIPLGRNHRSNNNLETMNQCCDKRFIELCEDVQKEKIYGDSLLNQLGTLGGGNHFIELQKDEDGNVHIMIHSGSRNFGAKVANRYCKIAKEHSQHGIPKDLEILESGTSEFYEYQLLMAFATEFAFQNRMVMMEDVKKSLLDFFPETQFHNVINIPHNYARVEGQKDGKNLYVHRKGATFVSSGVVGIIPGSMGSASYIVKGLDNPLSYYSCSHGAGRVMSRRKAKETLSMDTFVEDMKNVPNAEFEKHQLDESPRVYKEIDQVMEQQSDLVTIIKKLLPIRTIKG